MGLGYFILASLGFVFFVSATIHAFLSQTRPKVIGIVALLPNAILLLSVGETDWKLHAILLGLNIVGSALGTATGAVFRAIRGGFSNR